MTAGHKPLSPGERAVFAGEIARWRPTTIGEMRAASQRASDLVMLMRLASAHEASSVALTDDARAMLEDMLGHPGDLICPDGRTAAFTSIPDACVLCGKGAAYHRSRR